MNARPDHGSLRQPAAAFARPEQTDTPARKGREPDAVREAKAVRSLRESIAALDQDDELLNDVIEGETSLFEAVDMLLARMNDDRVHVAGIDAVTADMDVRRDRFLKRVDVNRALIEQAMMVAEIEKIERPTATLFLSRRKPKVEIATEADIPAEFWKSPDPVLDKKAVAEALGAGRTVPGAHLTNAAPSLTVRTK